VEIIEVPRKDAEIEPIRHFVPQINALHYNLIASKLITRMGHKKDVLRMEFQEAPSIASCLYSMRGELYVWIFRKIPRIED